MRWNAACAAKMSASLASAVTSTFVSIGIWISGVARPGPSRSAPFSTSTRIPDRRDCCTACMISCYRDGSVLMHAGVAAGDAATALASGRVGPGSGASVPAQRPALAARNCRRTLADRTAAPPGPCNPSSAVGKGGADGMTRMPYPRSRRKGPDAGIRRPGRAQARAPGTEHGAGTALPPGQCGVRSARGVRSPSSPGLSTRGGPSRPGAGRPWNLRCPAMRKSW